MQCAFTNSVDQTSTAPAENHYRISGKVKNLRIIVLDVPEVCEDFDEPDYEPVLNERKIEYDLIHKIIPEGVEGACYNNDDHDYLAVPFKNDDDHNYSIREGPACRNLDGRYFCNICQQNQKNVFKYTTHMTKHTIQNHVRCMFCNKTFLTTTCLNNHLSTHTRLCEMCLEETPIVQVAGHRLANLTQKLKMDRKFCAKTTHHDGGFICVFCAKTFRMYEKFNKHILVKHNQKDDILL